MADVWASSAAAAGFSASAPEFVPSSWASAGAAVMPASDYQTQTYAFVPWECVPQQAYYSGSEYMVDMSASQDGNYYMINTDQYAEAGGDWPRHDETSTMGNVNFINLDEYSDTSDTEEAPVSKAKQGLPSPVAASRSAAPEPAAEPLSAGDSGVTAAVDDTTRDADEPSGAAAVPAPCFREEDEDRAEGETPLDSSRMTEESTASEEAAPVEDAPVSPSSAVEEVLSSASSEPEAEDGEAEDEEEIAESITQQAAPVALGVHQLLLWRGLAAPGDDDRVADATDAIGGALRALAVEDAGGALKSPASEAPRGGRAGAATGEYRSSTALRRGGREEGLVGSRRGAERTTQAAPKKLQVSESSWAAQQRARRDGCEGAPAADAEVARKVKSILNKLTLEKFSSLSQQLVNCGIRTTEHVELLIQELFEKATTQHHFIDMYANLCVLLHEFFVECPVGDDPKFSFKRLLLNECQASFERHLTPPKGLTALDQEERTLTEVRYKTRMLGNIKFVGALLARRMLASKVLLAILQELLSEPTPEALESIAALLAAAGPTFDTPDWSYRPALNGIFAEVSTILEKPSCAPRARCLLKDVLDLRAKGWKDRRPKQIEGPATLGEVAQRAVDGEAAGAPRSPPRTPAAAPPRSPAATPQQRLRKSTAAVQPQARPTASIAAAAFDAETFRAEVQRALVELRHSGDAAGAGERLTAATPPPPAQQPRELSELLAQVAQEGAAETRKAGFVAVAQLFLQRHWQREALAEGLHDFSEEACPDLCMDVPDLPRILREEMCPALASLTQQGLLQASALNFAS